MGSPVLVTAPVLEPLVGPPHVVRGDALWPPAHAKHTCATRTLLPSKASQQTEHISPYSLCHSLVQAHNLIT